MTRLTNEPLRVAVNPLFINDKYRLDAVISNSHREQTPTQATTELTIVSLKFLLRLYG